MNSAKRATLIGICRGAELAHDAVGVALVFAVDPWLGAGVMLMGCGWMAARRQWEAVDEAAWRAELRRRYEGRRGATDGTKGAA